MDTERMKAQLRRLLVQLHSFEGLLYPSFSNQPTWDVWADSCHTLSDLASQLSDVSLHLAVEYEASLKEDNR